METMDYWNLTKYEKRWHLGFERYKFDKPGLIYISNCNQTNNVNVSYKNAIMSFKFEYNSSQILNKNTIKYTMWFLKSYENLGTSIVWINNKNDNILNLNQLEKLKFFECSPKFLSQYLVIENENMFVVDAEWQQSISIIDSQSFTVNINATKKLDPSDLGLTHYFNICVQTKKFKISSITASWHIYSQKTNEIQISLRKTFFIFGILQNLLNIMDFVRIKNEESRKNKNGKYYQTNYRTKITFNH